MKLDEKLVSLRKEKGLTQLKVAEELDISRQAISRWESGVAMPSTENLRRISELYRVPLDYLINEDSKRPDRVEEDNGEERKNRKWSSWLICILLIAVAVAIIIGAITVRKRPDKVNFNEVESEDWNDVSTEDIPIEWYDKYWRVQREWSDLAKIEPEEDVM